MPAKVGGLGEGYPVRREERTPTRLDKGEAFECAVLQAQRVDGRVADEPRPRKQAGQERKDPAGPATRMRLEAIA